MSDASIVGTRLSHGRGKRRSLGLFVVDIREQ
jgi:hypothetical protein